MLEAEASAALQKQETNLEKQLEKLVQAEPGERAEASQALLAQAAGATQAGEVSVCQPRDLARGGSRGNARIRCRRPRAAEAVAPSAGVPPAGQAANLQTQAGRDLQTQSAQLQTQQVKLQSQQQSAQSQQKQAKQLQSELTDELTQAGGDPRGTDTRLVNLQNALGATGGREGGLAATDQ